MHIRYASVIYVVATNCSQHINALKFPLSCSIGWESESILSFVTVCMDPATLEADVAVVWPSYVFVFQYFDSPNATETGQFLLSKTQPYF
jgi:hypothetical protein